MNIKEFIVNNSPKNIDGDLSPIILEAGTSEGYDTVWFANTFPKGKIYGIEPIKSLFNSVSFLTRANKNVKLFNYALSDKTGEAEMHVSLYYGRPTGSSSLLEPKDHIQLHPEITFNDKEKVNTINLDNFTEQNNIPYIDFMWLDLQGFEPIVLPAAPKTLNNTKYIYCEVTMIEYYKNNIKYPEFKTFMINNNFEVLDESEIYTPNGVINAGNVLFKNKNFN
jgi:FkbM family methyltransferase